MGHFIERKKIYMYPAALAVGLSSFGCHTSFSSRSAVQAARTCIGFGRTFLFGPGNRYSPMMFDMSKQLYFELCLMYMSACVRLSSLMGYKRTPRFPWKSTSTVNRRCCDGSITEQNRSSPYIFLYSGKVPSRTWSRFLVFSLVRCYRVFLEPIILAFISVSAFCLRLLLCLLTRSILTISLFASSSTIIYAGYSHA